MAVKNKVALSNEEKENICITDVAGTPIEVGHVIAYSRSGRNTKSLELGIVSSISLTKNGGSLTVLDSLKNKIGTVVDMKHSCFYCAKDREPFINNVKKELLQYFTNLQKDMIKNGITQSTSIYLLDQSYSKVAGHLHFARVYRECIIYMNNSTYYITEKDRITAEKNFSAFLSAVIDEGYINLKFNTIFADLRKYPSKDYCNKTTEILGKEASSSRTLLIGHEIQDHVIVLSNPVFAINNKNIAILMKVADLAKDDGILPKEYKFGQPCNAPKQKSKKVSSPVRYINAN